MHDHGFDHLPSVIDFRIELSPRSARPVRLRSAKSDWPRVGEEIKRKLEDIGLPADPSLDRLDETAEAFMRFAVQVVHADLPRARLSGGRLICPYCGLRFRLPKIMSPRLGGEMKIRWKRGEPLRSPVESTSTRSSNENKSTGRNFSLSLATSRRPMSTPGSQAWMLVCPYLPTRTSRRRLEKNG